MNILIADDSRLSRSYIKKILGVSGHLGASIIEVENGQAALNILLEKDIQCLFLDINMPIMTGIELIESLAEKNLLSKTEIVITSSVADGKCIDQLKERGIKYFLRKPFSPESLSEITGILKGKVA